MFAYFTFFTYFALIFTAEKKIDSPSSSKTQPNYCNETDNVSPADYVDANLTYETVERLSLSLAEEIISIDAERSKEFERRSASKTRSLSSSKKVAQPVASSSLSKSHIRKLTYSNEKLDDKNQSMHTLRRVKSYGGFPKCDLERQPKNRAATTELELTSEPTSSPKTLVEAPKEQESKIEETKEPKIEKIKRGRGRPKKIIQKAQPPKPNLSKTPNLTVSAEESIKQKVEKSNETLEKSQQELAINDQAEVKETNIASTSEGNKATKMKADNEKDISKRTSAEICLTVDGADGLNNAKPCGNEVEEGTATWTASKDANESIEKLAAPEIEENYIHNQGKAGHDSRDEMDIANENKINATDISTKNINTLVEDNKNNKQETDRTDDDNMENVDKNTSQIMNPEANIEKSDKEVTADDVDKRLTPNSVKKTRRSANTSRKSENRSARRLLRADADSSGTAAPAKRRSSPRVTEKSPAAATKKVDKEKSKSHSSAKAPRKSKADSSVQNLRHEESVKKRPPHSSKSTTAKAKDNSTTDKKSRARKPKPKMEIPPPKQMQVNESNLASTMQSASLPADGDSNETKIIDIKQNSEKDIETTTSSDTHIQIDVKAIESSRDAALTKTLSDLELLTTLDLNENSTYSEQQPNIPDTPSIPINNTAEDQNDLYKSLDLDIVVNKQENLCEELVVAKQRAAVPRGLRDVLQEAGIERQHERAGSRARSTRSRVGTPIPPKSRRTRIKGTKSTEAPIKEQTNDKPETKSDHTATCSELPIEEQEKEIPNTNICESDANQNINADAVESTVATDESERPTLCNNIRHAIEKGYQVGDQCTPSTCSSNSSCRKLRILIKKPVPRSKINFGQLENAEHADAEFEDSTYPSDQSVCNDVEEKATEGEPLNSLTDVPDQVENSSQITEDQQLQPAEAEANINEEDSAVRDAKDKLTDQEAASMTQQHNEKDDAIEEEKIAAEERQHEIETPPESQQSEQEASPQLANLEEQQPQQSEQIAAEPVEQLGDEQQRATDNIDKLCATETTGVMEYVDKEQCTDTGSSNQTDASEPDG